ncbi:MAG: aminoglycoside phosphotransferase family protein [Verrucomicrobiales bacterium]|nr:aminoglycoside phosphotransferase family protein [Verrucomicrobiales bacterium]
MRLGIDFDNTIVCYDALFHRVALEGGWIPADLPVNKTDVRNHLRATGREPIWTEMQGRVYGARMSEAAPYPGVKAFFRACRRAGIPVCIISHKTRRPFLGEPHDLHQAASDWLKQEGFFDETDIGLTRDQVFFELTKASKLDRIAACRCTHFVDDLPEFLGEAGFPPGVERLLFDPNRLYVEDRRFERMESWEALRERLIGVRSSEPAAPVQAAAIDFEAFLRSCGLRGPLRVEPMKGGANNQVFAVDAAEGRFILKRYFHGASDPRDRFGAERAFYQWTDRRAGARDQVPGAVGWEASARWGLFRRIEGRKITAPELTVAHLRQAIDFVIQLNQDRAVETSDALPMASEAFLDLAAHGDRVDQRVERLGKIEGATAIDREAGAFVSRALVPEWRRVREQTQKRLARGERGLGVLSPAERCASPSDFGFHNALLSEDGRLRFFDFEYAGWDDPGKLVCDFFLQPQVPVPASHWREVVASLELGFGIRPGELATRSEVLWPVYVVKWCCILMNEFLPSESARRGFAWGPEEAERRKAAQLAKARALLMRTTESRG